MNRDADELPGCCGEIMEPRPGGGAVCRTCGRRTEPEAPATEAAFPAAAAKVHHDADILEEHLRRMNRLEKEELGRETAKLFKILRTATEAAQSPATGTDAGRPEGGA